MSQVQVRPPESHVDLLQRPLALPIEAETQLNCQTLPGGQKLTPPVRT